MKRLFSLLFLLLIAVILSGCTLIPRRKVSALTVTTTPKATIFLDGEHLGQTPFFSEKLKPGEYVLKIVPESSGQALNPWEGRVTLSPNIMTIVNRELGLTQDLSSGEILSFEPLADKNAVSISVVTTPDGATVYLDGEPKGYAPLTINNISEGDHHLIISSTGFQEKTIKAKTVKGNKLIVSVQLARQTAVVADSQIDQESTPSASTSPTASPKASPKSSPTASPKASPKSSPTASGELVRPYVEINAPDTGWVNVRSEASTAGGDDTILTKVDHGEKFPLIDSDSGWYKIEYAANKQGWISGKYAEKFE